MYCKFCGHKIDDGSKFCEACGKKLDDKINIIDDNIAKETKEDFEYHIAVIKEEMNKNPKRAKTIIGISAIILSILIVIFIANAIPSKYIDKDSTPPEVTNTFMRLLSENKLWEAKKLCIAAFWNNFSKHDEIIEIAKSGDYDYLGYEYNGRYYVRYDIDGKYDKYNYCFDIILVSQRGILKIDRIN